MYISNVAIFSVLTALAQAFPTAHSVRHESRSLHHESKWQKRGLAPASVKLPVRIAINQRNIDLGHNLLMDISNPESPNYGKHMSSKEVGEFFSPSGDSIETITQWLSDAGIGADRHVVSPGKSWVKFDATVEELEELINAKYSTYTHVETGEEHIACDEYYVPHSVHPHIDFITPTVGTDARLKKKTIKRASKAVGALPPVHLGSVADISLTAAANTSCSAGLSPSCIATAYGVPALTTAQSGNQLGIFETGDYYDQADLNAFWAKYAPNIPSGTGPKLNAVDGAVAPESQQKEANQENGEESLLDFEIAIPMIWPQTTILYQVDDADQVGQGFGNTFLDALDASYCTFEGGDDSSIDPSYPDSIYKQSEMCGAYTPTNVISVSYGFDETTFPAAYLTRQCQEYMKLGLQGVSIIYASGDSGVASRDGCLKNGKTFAPGFPATCPYVTSVGATQLVGSSPTGTEVAAAVASVEFYSGGGFSNLFAQPSYQNTALSSYFANHKPTYASSVYNASGRGFPDVSAFGVNIINIDGGKQILQGGTSASAPIFASIITLINEQRLAAGKSPAGFLNPTLYANPSAFTDITSGSNPGCGTNGFSAVSGWDPVTGLGTPKFSSLLSVFLALP